MSTSILIKKAKKVSFMLQSSFFFVILTNSFSLGLFWCFKRDSFSCRTVNIHLTIMDGEGVTSDMAARCLLSWDLVRGRRRSEGLEHVNAR